MAHHTDDELAAALALDAGHLLLALRDELGFADPAQLRAEGDRRSHLFLLEQLGRHRPGDAVLSEEGKDSADRLTAGRVWIVDPLDGTREFGEEGRVDWAVHVALVEGGRLTAGAVALPASGTVHATPVASATPAPAGPLRFLVSRSRAHPSTVRAAELLGGAVVPLGSAGAKAMTVVRGEADVYLHAGGQYEWDTAAPAAVAASAGLHVSAIDGSPLAWNKPDPWSPTVLLCHPSVVDAVTGAFRRAEAETDTVADPGR